MKKYLEGTGMTAFFYVLVLMVGYFVDTRFVGGFEVSGIFIGALTVTIPYILLGVFSSIILGERSSLKSVIRLGLFVIIVERLAVYLIGFTHFLRDVGPREPVWLIGLPYYTPVYIFFGGVVSLLLYIVVASLQRKNVKAA
ncbi:hypothetical protein [Halobacillus aidingensis]|uniref:Uncharacterized protein n=1 Tax=Halobacillus aidingensis TaxID=240303 RepID=A0A1H0H4P6_HALAD|nr:hypothetical protein [Halobacillus aidingensis]SDO14102.1 hypothetical protein SAMN05421677_10351 [Halobacillus aidingensis]